MSKGRASKKATKRGGIPRPASSGAKRNPATGEPRRPGTRDESERGTNPTLRLDEEARARRKVRVSPKGGFEATSETSRMAAEAMDPTDITAQEGRILHALRTRSAPTSSGSTGSKKRKTKPAAGRLLEPEEGGGMTDKEIEAATGLSHESASARRRGLVLRGLVMESGHVRLTPSHRWANVWILGRQEAIAGGKNDYARRPSGEEMRAAIALIRSRKPAARKLVAWLKRIATEGAS